jgi:lambda repressor-like predicted transcriptional regulator
MTEMRKRRLAAGLTLAALSRKSRVNYSTLQSLDVGRGKNYNPRFKKAVAEALGARGAEDFFKLWPEELKKLKHLEF